MIQTLSDLKTVRFNEQADGVIILDQTLLPGKDASLTLTTAQTEPVTLQFTVLEEEASWN